MVFNRRLTTTELLVMVGSAAALVLILLPALGRAGDAARRLNCQSNLKMWSAALRMYADEARSGCFPPMGVRASRANPGALGWVPGPSGALMYPDYLDDLSAYFCPADETSDLRKYIGGRTGDWDAPDGPLDSSPFDDRSYFYHGFVAENLNVHITLMADARFLEAVTPFSAPEQYAAFANDTVVLEEIDDARVLQDAVIDPFFQAVDTDVSGAGPIRAQGNAGTKRIFRLRDGIERFFITDISAPSIADRARTEVPVMWDAMDLRGRGFAHEPPGINVLYLDGHVDFVRYPHTYPATQAVAILGRGIG